jgi:hypothetical protein
LVSASSLGKDPRFFVIFRFNCIFCGELLVVMLGWTIENGHLVSVFDTKLIDGVKSLLCGDQKRRGREDPRPIAPVGKM